MINTIEQDIKNLTRTELKDKYQLTYTSWRNMKERKKQGAVIHQAFNDFASFLHLVGERKSESYTLDRIDNNDLEYAPDKVRWVDKAVQNSNKSDTKLLTYGGETLTVSQWAKRTEQDPSTLYKRINRGLSDCEVITGIKFNEDYNINHPWPYGKGGIWEDKYNRYLVAGGHGKALTKLQFFIVVLDRSIASLRGRHRAYQYLINQYEYQETIENTSYDMADPEFFVYEDPFYEEFSAAKHDERVWYENVHRNIRENEGKSLSEIQELSSEIGAEISNRQFCLNQAKAYQGYENSREKAIENKFDGLSKEALMKAFHSVVSVPAYTINQPNWQQSLRASNHSY